MAEEKLFRARSWRSRVLAIGAAHAPPYDQRQEDDPANVSHRFRMTSLCGLLQWGFPLKTIRGTD